MPGTPERQKAKPEDQQQTPPPPIAPHPPTKATLIFPCLKRSGEWRRRGYRKIRKSCQSRTKALNPLGKSDDMQDYVPRGTFSYIAITRLDVPRGTCCGVKTTKNVPRGTYRACGWPQESDFWENRSREGCGQRPLVTPVGCAAGWPGLRKTREIVLRTIRRPLSPPRNCPAPSSRRHGRNQSPACCRFAPSPCRRRT